MRCGKVNVQSCHVITKNYISNQASPILHFIHFRFWSFEWSLNGSFWNRRNIFIAKLRKCPIGNSNKLCPIQFMYLLHFFSSTLVQFLNGCWTVAERLLMPFSHACKFFSKPACFWTRISVFAVGDHSFPKLGFVGIIVFLHKSAPLHRMTFSPIKRRHYYKSVWFIAVSKTQKSKYESAKLPEGFSEKRPKLLIRAIITINKCTTKNFFNYHQ
jgi:hypothetical protein